MKVFGYSEYDLKSLGGARTAFEINQQPTVWRKIWVSINEQKEELGSFLKEATENSHNIILTGAGTSAFIGLSLQGVFRKHLHKVTESIPATHLVSHPKDYFAKDTPVLLVSFDKSGDSPESKAVVELVDKYSSACFHLVITCNSNGELAQRGSNNCKYVFLLPEESNDKNSSYSGMLLAGILIARIKEIEQIKEQVLKLANYGNKLIDESEAIKNIAEKNFKKAVFLGSGPLYGTAKEAHLKFQELTDGKLICKYDSYLGFRHEPKTDIDDSTLVMYLFSNGKHVLKYEQNLVNSMLKRNKMLFEIGVMELNVEIPSLDYAIIMEIDGIGVDEEFLAVCSIIPAQLLGFHKSISLGLSPDKPSRSGQSQEFAENIGRFR